MTNTFTLKPSPNWHYAAQDLVDSLQVLHTATDKITLLESVCVQLGDSLYPAFLQILYSLERNEDSTSTDVVATTLVDCIRTGRLPSGRLPAWGSSSVIGDTAFGQTRVLGPIEYACAWYAQGGTAQALTRLQFTQIINSLLRLVGANTTAKDHYCQKLQGDIDDPIGGALSNTTRDALQALITQWQRDDKPILAIDAFISALQPQSLLDQVAEERLEQYATSLIR